MRQRKDCNRWKKRKKKKHTRKEEESSRTFLVSRASCRGGYMGFFFFFFLGWFSGCYVADCVGGLFTPYIIEGYLPHILSKALIE